MQRQGGAPASSSASASTAGPTTLDAAEAGVPAGEAKAKDPASSTPKTKQSSASLFARVMAALLYGVSSLGVMFVNKLVLSAYGFPQPQLVALAQFIATATILYTCSALGVLRIPPLSAAVVKDVGPVSVLFLCNVLSGLAGTKEINIPMFTALRRFSILFTMMLQWLVLGDKPSATVAMSVILMLFGALIAAAYDLTFDAYGYAMIMLNNAFTAGNGVYLKKASLSPLMTKWAVMYYNSLFSALLLSAVVLVTEQEALTAVLAFPGWRDGVFVALFVSSAAMGCLLNYAIYVCTTTNSALTTTVVGCLKNVLTTFVSMVVMTDYQFTPLNFVGINVSILGSLIYSWVTFRG